MHQIRAVKTDHQTAQAQGHEQAQDQSPTFDSSV